MIMVVLLFKERGLSVGGTVKLLEVESSGAQLIWGKCAERPARPGDH